MILLRLSTLRGTKNAFLFFKGTTSTLVLFIWKGLSGILCVKGYKVYEGGNSSKEKARMPTSSVFLLLHYTLIIQLNRFFWFVLQTEVNTCCVFVNCLKSKVRNKITKRIILVGLHFDAVCFRIQSFCNDFEPLHYAWSSITVQKHAFPLQRKTSAIFYDSIWIKTSWKRVLEQSANKLP